MEYLFQFRRDGTEGGMILVIEKLIRHKGKQPRSQALKSQKVIKETTVNVKKLNVAFNKNIIAV
jgi:hypothetical protein